MAGISGKSGGVRRTLLKPFRLASVLAGVAILLSLAFLGYSAWMTDSRLDPLERHIAHLQGLQDVSLDIQGLLIRHLRENTPADPAELQKVSLTLEKLLEAGDHLQADTPDRLRKARDLLNAADGDVQTNLLAVLSVVRQTLVAESALQRSAIAQIRRSAELELALAASAIVIAPILSILLLGYFRRRTFRSINQLSSLLENVGNLEFREPAPIDEDDPLLDVFQRYRAMSDKLRETTELANRRTENLEKQVRAASETLLRQQAELENGARLAALGEFSGRLAHELRNPISGISVALHNMETELSDPDLVARIGMITEEMDRVTRLLNSLLAKSPSGPERPSRVSLTSLAQNVVQLFEYQLPDRISVNTHFDDAECYLPRDTVRQVLINLLKNSRDAIGERPGNISVRFECDGGECRMTVSDDGPGYPEDLLRHGIKPFKSGKAAGTGLGLSVVQRLVYSAGGKLNLDNSPGGGAAAVVTFPCEE
ncbi:MAG: hypothetical protein Kow0026_12610 [Oricola sp.]